MPGRCIACLLALLKLTQKAYGSIGNACAALLDAFKKGHILLSIGRRYHLFDLAIWREAARSDRCLLVSCRTDALLPKVCVGGFWGHQERGPWQGPSARFLRLFISL